MNLLKMEPEEFEAFLTESVARTLYANIGQDTPPHAEWSKAPREVRQRWRDAAGNAIAVYRLINQEREDQDRASYVREVLR